MHFEAGPLRLFAAGAALANVVKLEDILGLDWRAALRRSI
jgi:hypothetical protein